MVHFYNTQPARWLLPCSIPVLVSNSSTSAHYDTIGNGNSGPDLYPVKYVDPFRNPDALTIPDQYANGFGNPYTVSYINLYGNCLGYPIANTNTNSNLNRWWRWRDPI